MFNGASKSFILAGTAAVSALLLVACIDETPSKAVLPPEYTETVPKEILDLVSSDDAIETESIESELYIPDEYYEVIDSIVLFVDNEDLGDENPYWDSEYVGGTYELLYYENTKDIIGFAFIDIDGDNTAELAILDGSNDEHLYRIIDFYAYYDGTVNRVFSGGYRCAYYLTKDMVFCCLGSSGAMYSLVDYSEYDAETNELSLVESYYTSPISENWADGVGLYHYTDSDVEEIEIYSADDSIDLFDIYGVDESDLYDFGDITTLTEYCGE